MLSVICGLCYNNNNKLTSFIICICIWSKTIKGKVPLLSSSKILNSSGKTYSCSRLCSFLIQVLSNTKVYLTEYYINAISKALPQSMCNAGSSEDFINVLRFLYAFISFYMLSQLSKEDCRSSLQKFTLKLKDSSWHRAWYWYWKQ